jgi:hypothetical protein
VWFCGRRDDDDARRLRDRAGAAQAVSAVAARARLFERHHEELGTMCLHELERRFRRFRGSDQLDADSFEEICHGAQPDRMRVQHHRCASTHRPTLPE